MNELRLAVERTEYPDHPPLIVSTLEIHVDGQSLSSLARVVEEPFATADGQPDLAGSYSGLRLVAGEITREHFLGHPQFTWFDDGDTVLLGCECGEWGCWPLTATVSLDSEVIRWDNFRTGHRGWDLSRLGPFEFNRSDYETAIDDALQCVG